MDFGAKLALGIGVGLIVGVLIDQIALGIVFGAAGGLLWSQFNE